MFLLSKPCRPGMTFEAVRLNFSGREPRIFS